MRGPLGATRQLFGPLGVTPTVIGPPQTSLIEWLDAANITGLADGDAISTWTARTGTNATATLTARPLYKTGIQNSLPIVRADGSNDLMSLTGLVAALGSFTFVAAFNPYVTSPSGKFLFDTQTGRLTIAQVGGATGKIGWLNGVTWRNIANATTGWQVVAWVLTSGGNGEIFRNGVSLGTAVYTATAIGGNVALFAFTATGYNLQCDLGELLIYSAALDTSTRAAAESYLNSKWAIY